MSVAVLQGDARTVLATLPDASVHCCVTSPPYWGLRNYEVDGQLGLEPTPDEYVANMVAVFREVRRVLRDDGTVFLNLGDSYARDERKGQHKPGDSGKQDYIIRRGGGRAASGLRFPSAPAYGSGGTAPRGSTGPDSACSDLCDGCRAAVSSRNGHSDQPPRGAASLPLPTDRDSERSDSGVGPLVALPPDGPASTTPESSSPLSAECSHCGNCGACLSVLGSSRRDARLCVRRVEYIGGSGPLASVSRNQDMGALGMACLNYNLKPKDMVGIPWLVALALRADGWWLRSDIIWHKPNPMPESVTDRPTKAHEYVFLLAKSERYYFDQEAVREPHTSGENTPEGLAARAAIGDPNGKRASTKSMNDGRDRTKPPSRPPGYIGHVNGRNIRTVWTIPTEPYAEAHFATFPTALAQRCIMAGSSERGCCTTCGAPWVSETQKGQAHDAGGGHRAHAEQRARQGVNGAMETGIWFDRVTLGWRASCQHLGEPVPCTVLDPFAGSGTVGQVAEDLGRDSVLVELNAEYVRLIRKRTGQAGLFASRAESAEKGSP